MNLHFESAFPWGWLLMLTALVVLIASLKRDALSKGRLYGATAVRVLIVALILAAVANPVYESRVTRGQRILFVLDASASISEAGRRRAAGVIREIARLQTDECTAGLVTFARTPRVAVAPRTGFDGRVPHVAVDTDATDIAGALELGMSLFPAGGARTLVLLSDGNETRGRARRAAGLARRHGVVIHTVPLERETRSAGGVEKLIAPSRVRLGERFRLRALLTNDARRPAYARIVVRKDGVPVSTRERVPIRPGSTPVTMDYKLSSPGLHAFDLVITRDDGAVSVTPSVFIDAVDRPRVLIVSPEASGRNFFGEVMRRRSFEIDTRETLPDTLDALLRYDCVVLNDVGRQALPDPTLYTLQRYVQHFGGGLVTIGGGATSSLEEFAATPLEEMLPVKLEIRRTLKKKRRDFVLLLLIDRSGSMEGEKLEMAKASAIDAIGELEPGDSVGVIAFDDEAHRVVDLTVLGEDKSGVISDVRRLTSGGGTDARMALVEAYRLFQHKKINIRKHIILMTDGVTVQRQLLDITRRVARKGITISTIAIGEDANIPILDTMRRIGGGAFHVVRKFSDLPRIVVGDMGAQVKRADDVDDRFVPQIADASPMLSGIRQDDVPSLHGYVVSTLKIAATKPLMTDFRNTGDPILAHWYYGLGRSTVFTAGVNSSWSEEWLRWRNFGKLWEQIIRWTMRPQSGHDYFFHIRRDANRLRLRVEVESGDTVPSALQGTLQRPDGRLTTARFRRIGRNLFEGAFATPDSGMAELALAEEGGATPATWAGRIYVPGVPDAGFESAEIDGAPPNLALLQDIAHTSGGIFDPRPSDVITPQAAARVAHSLRDGLLIPSLFLLLVDIALRRMDVPYRAFTAKCRVIRRRMTRQMSRSFRNLLPR